jgi:hypothetical protein
MTMRPFVAGSALSLLVALPLTAQFEGTVVMNLTPADKHAGEMTYYIKNNQLASSVLIASGQMSGQTVRMLYDIPNGKVSLLMPMAMGGAKGIKMDIDLRAQAGAHHTTEVKPLGTSQTIAGRHCEDLQIVLDGKPSGKVCVSSELGTFAMANMNPAGRGASAPDWAAAFSGRPMFPLKVVGADGKVVMEATAVHAGPVQAEMFAVPDGYMDMGGMSGMMNGMGRGPTKP